MPNYSKIRHDAKRRFTTCLPLLKSHGYNQKQARRNVSSPSLSFFLTIRSSGQNWENDTCLPEVPILIQISDIYNTSLDQLLRIDSRPYSNKASDVQRYTQIETNELLPDLPLYLEFFEDSWYGGLYEAWIFDPRYDYKMRIRMCLKKDSDYQEFYSETLEEIPIHLRGYMDQIEKLYGNKPDYSIVFHELFADGYAL